MLAGNTPGTRVSNPDATPEGSPDLTAIRVGDRDLRPRHGAEPGGLRFLQSY